MWSLSRFPLIPRYDDISVVLTHDYGSIRHLMLAPLQRDDYQHGGFPNKTKSLPRVMAMNLTLLEYWAF